MEINSHSLFSKWFSESGKLVQKLFSAVHEMVDDEDCFVVVMIGEWTLRGGLLSERIDYLGNWRIARTKNEQNG